MAGTRVIQVRSDATTSTVYDTKARQGTTVPEPTQCGPGRIRPSPILCTLESQLTGAGMGPMD